MAVAELELLRDVGGYTKAAVGAVADSAGLTSEDDYLGWVALAVIAYAVLYPPLKTVYHIEQQIAGVLDQLYSWLGGAGSAINGGIKSIENAAGALGKDISNALRWI